METLKHECGVALIRLLKPLEYYQEKYGTWMYGLNKLYLLMEKQHNRGQEAAGLACVKLQANPGEEYMFRERGLGAGAITEIFNNVHQQYKDLTEEQLHDAEFAKKCLPFAGELYMGHLRYSTTGKSGISYVHPFLRRNNWRAKNLALCGNFNLTNVDEIFADITEAGQHPRKYADTYIMLEQVGHRLDREVERLYKQCKEEGLKGMDITHAIEERIDLTNVLKTSSPSWDGGYVICGMTGSGETFAVRDPWGIRPAFWYQDDEIAVLASERPVIQTALNVSADRIRELQPGQALLINKAGKLRTVQISNTPEQKTCSFERIYFSRGSDMDIYKERKLLGEKLVPNILKAIDKDIDHTVFSFIPNTAEVAFYGMLQGLDDYLNEEKVQQLIRNCTWSQIPQAKEAADDIRILFFAGYMSQSAPAQHPEGQDEVGDGEAVMVLQGSWVPNEVTEATESDDSWGFFPWPAVKAGTDGTEGVMVGAQGFGVTKDSQMKQEAFDFAYSICTGETDMKMTDAVNSIPADTDNTQWPEVLADAVPYMKEMSKPYMWAAGLEADPDYKEQIQSELLKLTRLEETSDEFIENLSNMK